MRNDPAYRAGQVIVVFVLYSKFAFRQAIPPVMHERNERNIPIKSSCRTSILSHHRTMVLGRGKVPGRWPDPLIETLTIDNSNIFAHRYSRDELVFGKVSSLRRNLPATWIGQDTSDFADGAFTQRLG